jgi:ATP-dependent DNA helicase RecQ
MCLRLAPDWNWSSCAVIAREWKYLDPIRAWCEGSQKLVSAAALGEWLAAQGAGPWWAGKMTANRQILAVLMVK